MLDLLIWTHLVYEHPFYTNKLSSMQVNHCQDSYV